MVLSAFMAVDSWIEALTTHKMLTLKNKEAKSMRGQGRLLPAAHAVPRAPSAGGPNLC